MVLFHRHRAWRVYKELSKRPKGIENELLELKKAIYHKSGKEAYKEALRLQKKKKLTKTWIDHTREGVFALIFALVAATLIRTMWFELYEIPSGSMRPTYQEGDHLIASKISFGINVPLIPKHFFFEPKLLQNGQVVIFTVDNMAVHDPDTTYFLLFPGKRMLIKRLIGKPGDSLYFYGGKIYGVSEEGQTFTIESEHVPYINFEGRTSRDQGAVFFEQSGQTLAKIELPGRPFVYQEGNWVQGNYFAKAFGMNNYAMVKMVGNTLQIASFPSLSNPLHINGHLLLNPVIHTVEMKEIHKKRLFDSLSTSRFTLTKGRSGGLFLPGVPDGTYQMTQGLFEEIHYPSRAHALPTNHPLYNTAFLEGLFNSGIDFLNIYTKTSLPLFPQRFAYYENGDLKINGAVIYTSDDPVLKEFVQKQQREAYPFIDYKPLLTPEFIRKEGLKIPEKMYYVLGDNYTNSADSRDFGFLPEDNIRGTPSFIFWPPGKRFGPPAPPTGPWLTVPHAIMGVLVLIVCIASWRYYYRIPPHE